MTDVGARQLNMNDVVHAAVRRDLARFARALEEFPAGNRERASELRRAWASMTDQLHHHHTSEDTHIWPYLRGLDVLDPEVIDAMEREHRVMSTALNRVSAAFDRLVDEPTSASARAATEALEQGRAATEEHLEHEETEVVPVIAERMDTPEWKAVEKQLRKASPVQTGRMLAWVEDCAEPQYRAVVSEAMPAPVRVVFSRVLGRGYHREVAPVWR